MDPAMTPAFEQRARETVLRDKNHPSIIVWGVGNENYGKNPAPICRIAADLARQLDPTRPRLVSGCQAEKIQRRDGRLSLSDADDDDQPARRHKAASEVAADVFRTP